VSMMSTIIRLADKAVMGAKRAVDANHSWLLRSQST
jgi:hypothetical protein